MIFLVLQTPVEKLIEDLNIEIPHTPILCIDSISERSIVIHWDIEIKFDENLYYVIVVNEQETLTSTSCRLNNLTPHQLYQIEIIAVNSITNFKSQSKPVFVHTSNDKELMGLSMLIIWRPRSKRSNLLVDLRSISIGNHNHRPNQEYQRFKFVE